MNKYRINERVRFKGDDVDYVVDFVNEDGSVDLDLVEPDDSATVTFVPARVLERVPDDVRPGDVYRSVTHPHVVAYVIPGSKDHSQLRYITGGGEEFRLLPYFAYILSNPNHYERLSRVDGL